ncbi:hypothetical protein GCM10010329_50470 [Streptomyces spiroverticillatus]|uniref:histidine kinase n=1 Tax=Streptomyces finlayi TaxID=67296 RepID=A0A918X1Q1_9ACTN|nr:HAMP domain-containing sensor histidine kinase [Streptomyces finlayi]GHA20944.1 hypothetical protein GCM10010329_50470 [Streptomyces spiroverticillatus]GHD03523.1 hypothetical protein GCM10010334_51420 [Streptomyces finlayi]
MTLRARLVLVVVALLVLGMALSVGATFGALQDWRSDRADEVLVAAADAVRGELDLPRGGQTEAVWEAAAGRGDVPSFFQVRGRDGSVRETADFGGRPPVAGTYGPGFHELPDGGWLLYGKTLPDGLLLVGMRTDGADELVRRTAVVAVTSGVVALLAVALLSWHGVRRGLRPLEAIAETASAIGEGDLARRVPPAGPRTEVGRLGAALNAMLARLEAAAEERRRSEERLRRFVADASHELRTPVATVRGYAELFRRGAAERPEDLARAMARIESEARRMGSLVEELLLLAKLDEGLPMGSEEVDLTVLAAEAVDDARVRAPEHPLWLEDSGGPVVVRGDADRLRQVLANLLANVRQHTPSGTRAWVRVAHEGGAAVLDVRDEGPGLGSGDPARVFARFYRTDASRAAHGEGAGLGLAIVAAVAEAHGGSAEVVPAARGAHFRVRVPLSGARGTARATPHPAARPSALGEGAGLGPPWPSGPGLHVPGTGRRPEGPGAARTRHPRCGQGPVPGRARIGRIAPLPARPAPGGRPRRPRGLGKRGVGAAPPPKGARERGGGGAPPRG